MTFLNYINDLIRGYLGELGPLMVLAIFAAIFIAIALSLLLNRSEDPLDRLKRQAVEKKGDQAKKADLRQGGRNEKLERFASYLEPQNVDDRSAMELTLTKAGYQSQDAVRIFHLAQFSLGILGLLLGVAYVMLLSASQDLTSQQLTLYILVPGAIGYFLPRYWVTRRVGERQAQIESGFPDSLDMMLVCIEAGQSLDQSIGRVGVELRTSCPALADEFGIVVKEIKAGKDRNSVLRDMAERCGVSDVSSFVTVMIQSQSFGTSISEALRVYSAEMRDKRVMRAEEAANKLPTKMTLVTMTLTIPPLLIILISPSMNNLSQLGQ